MTELSGTAATTRLLWVNPVHTAAYDAEMAGNLGALVGPSVEVDVLSFDPPGPTHLEFATHGVAVGNRLLSAIRWAREDRYDAVCIGCFYDPGLRAARELAGTMAVTAPAEACMHTATVLGSRVCVLVANPDCTAEAREAVERTGLGGRVASYRSLGMRVHDFQESPERTRARMLEQARAAIESDGADVVVLGCTLEYGLGESVQRELGVPVLDATSTPLTFAEYLVSLGRRGQWYASGLDYRPPPDAELDWLPPAQRPGPLTAAATDPAAAETAGR